MVEGKKTGKFVSDSPTKPNPPKNPPPKVERRGEGPIGK